MADINGVNSATSVYEQINQQNRSASNQPTQAESDSQMFMKLMIAQLQNQDPTSPADTTDFMQQISSMSTVESINNLNTTMTDMSSALMTSQAALQASSMVGQMAYIKTDKAILGTSGEIKGVVSLPLSAPDLRITIYDSAGRKVDSWSAGSKTAGDHDFTWKSDGELPQGEYRVVAETSDGKGGYITAESYIGHTVNSVTLGQNGIGMRINTGAGAVDISDIKQIGQG